MTDHREAREERRRELVARAFGPEGTADDRRALAEHDRRPVPRVVAEEPRAPRRGILRVVVAAVVLAIVAGGAFAAGSLLHGAPGFTAAAPTSSSTPMDAAARLNAVETRLPAFVPPDFTSAGVPRDIPLKLIPTNLDPTSFADAGFDTTTLHPGTHIYVARDTTHYDCLVVVHQGTLSSVCTSASYFPASGLTLTWTDDGAAFTIAWQLDGSMTLAFS